MKPFDLEAALAGEPVQTRAGNVIKCIVHDPQNPNPSYRVWWRADDDNETMYSCDVLGRHYDDGLTSEYDLFMSPKHQTLWVNFYPSGVSTWFESRTEADRAWLVNAGRRLGDQAHEITLEI